MDKIKDKKKFLKKLSLLTCFILLIALINVCLTNVNAETNNTSPSIKANLISATPNPANSSDNIEIKYNITTEPFKYNGTSIIDEAVFVVDLSSKMGLGNRWSLMQNEFTNILLNGQTLQNQNIKFGVVGYNDSVKHPIENGQYDKLFNRNDSAEKETLRKLLQEPNSTEHESIYPESNIDIRKIDTALEKADYLLQNKGDANKNKAIVLVNSTSVNYSQAEIDIIKNRGYKIISIDMSCDQNQNSTSNLKELHEKLLGSDYDYFKSKNDGDNFNFGNRDMQNVADSLKVGISTKTLSIADAKLNFDLNDNFEYVQNSASSNIKNCLSEGNNLSLDLPTINYTATTKNSDGTYVHTASSFTVSFTIKPKAGKTGNLGFLNDSETDPPENLRNYISYNKLDNTATKEHVDTPTINVVDETLPHINATLESATPNPANTTDDIDVKYKIDTEPFEYNSSNFGLGLIDEAVFIVDLSHDMNTTGEDRWQLMYPWFEKILLNDESNILQGQKIKLGLVGYNGIEKYPSEGGQYDKLFDRTNEDEKNQLKESITNMKTKIQSNSSSKKSEIGLGLEKADKLLTVGVENIRKAIILINCSDIDDSVYSDTIINLIKTKGYKIISLNMEWAPGQTKKSALLSLHESLGGMNSDYLVSGAYNSNKGSGEEDMINIANRLNPGVSNSLSISDAKLNFDLGENFDAVEGSGLEGIDKRPTVTLPEIKYTLIKDDISGKYLWHQTEPQSLEITFKVKAASGKYEQLGFGPADNNTISYTNLGQTLTNKKIDTPIITINSVIALKHGLYKGIDTVSGNPIIDETQRTFAKGATVPLAGFVDGATNGNRITLTILDPDVVEIIGDVKVYEIGNTTPIGTMSGIGRDYIYTVSGLSNISGKILILYNEKLPEVLGDYKNIIRVQSVTKDAIATVGDIDQPDLL